MDHYNTGMALTRFLWVWLWYQELGPLLHYLQTSQEPRKEHKFADGELEKTNVT